MSRFFTLVLALLITFSLIGCAGSESDPADTVINYLEALVAKDVDEVVNLSCADWESDARAEVDSLQAVELTLQDAACETASQTGDQATVNCTGTLVATYDGEGQPLSLDRQTYQLVMESGQWRVCGYE